MFVIAPASEKASRTNNNYEPFFIFKNNDHIIHQRTKSHGSVIKIRSPVVAEEEKLVEARGMTSFVIATAGELTN